MLYYFSDRITARFVCIAPSSLFYHCVVTCNARQFVSKATKKAFSYGEGGTTPEVTDEEKDGVAITTFCNWK